MSTAQQQGRAASSGRPVSSFGRPAPHQQDQVVMLPPLAMPAVQVPLKLVIDVTSLQEAAAQITAMVAEAFAAGIGQAAGELGPPADPGPEPQS